jgi:hypothetical protein
MWKLEFVGYNGGYYPLAKLYYAVGHEVKDNIIADKEMEIKKAKGVKRGTISKDEYIKLINGSPICKNDPRFVLNRKDSSVTLKDVTINISSDLFKRIIVKQGDQIGTRAHTVLDGILQD